MNRNIASVSPADPPEQVAEFALTHQIPAVPVMDDQGCLLGAVPAHTVFRIMREEHIQDVDHLVGIWRNSDQALSVIEGKPLRRVMDRLPWLIVGTAGCVLATGLMATFENTLRTDLAVAFLSLVSFIWPTPSERNPKQLRCGDFCSVTRRFLSC